MNEFLEKFSQTLQHTPLTGSLCFEIDGQNYKFLANGTIITDETPCECVIITSKDVLKQLLAKQTSPMQAYFSGQLKIKGDMGIAMSLAQILSEHIA